MCWFPEKSAAEGETGEDKTHGRCGEDGGEVEGTTDDYTEERVNHPHVEDADITFTEQGSQCC